MQIHPCVSFIIIKDNCILLEHRSLNKATDAGAIAIPGGHIETDECHITALRREVKEELDIEVTQQHYLCSLYHLSGELQLLHYYVVNQWQGEIKSLEADSVNWYPLTPDSAQLEADKLAISEYLRVNHILSINE